MDLLPIFENAIIPIEKFTEYALHPVKSRGKFHAFKKAMGYDLENYQKLIDNIRNNINKFPAIPKDDNGFGIRYEVFMKLTGENGKKANVLTGWIVEHESGKVRLTTAYITEGRE